MSLLSAGEALAVAAHRLGAVEAGEHRRLARRRLREPLDAEARVYALGVLLDEAAERRAHLRVHRVVRRRAPYPDAVDE